MATMATILLVDDDWEQLASLRIAVEALGHRVLVEADGKAGLISASRHVPDLIITDWKMPVMDGCEMCARLKSSPALRHIPVLVFSGSEHGVSAPCDGFLRKPCNLELLSAAAVRL